MFPVMRVLQANLGDGRDAQNLVLQTAREERIDVVMLSELYRPQRTTEGGLLTR